MIRVFWKLVLEVLPPACATVLAGILLSVYRDHLIPLQNIIDPRTSVEQAAPPATDGADLRPTSVRVLPEYAASPAQNDGKSPAPGANVQAREGNPADGKDTTKGHETQALEVKPPEAPTANAQTAQLNAVLMASSPMAPPAEMKAAQPADTPSQSAASPNTDEVTKPATDGSPTPAKPAAAAKAPAGKPSVLRPRLSQRLERSSHKSTLSKVDWEKLPPSIAMLPLPAPAAPPPPTATTEPPAQVVGPNRQGSAPLPQSLSSPQASGQTIPAILPNAGATGASASVGPQTLPGAPLAGLTAREDGAAKTQEPKRVFGVPIPPPIIAVGDALDPRPVLSAGQRVFEKIVTTAKSVVPDFSHEP